MRWPFLAFGLAFFYLTIVWISTRRFYDVELQGDNLFAMVVGVVLSRSGSLATDTQVLVPAGAVARPLLRWVAPYAALVGVAYLSPLAVLAWVLHDPAVIMNPRWRIGALIGRRVKGVAHRGQESPATPSGGLAGGP